MIINSNIEMNKNHYLIGNESNSVKSELLLITRCFLSHQIRCNWRDSLFSLSHIVLLALEENTDTEGKLSKYLCKVPCRKGPVSGSQENKNEDRFRLAGVSAKQAASMELMMDRKTGVPDTKTWTWIFQLLSVRVEFLGVRMCLLELIFLEAYFGHFK